MSAGIIGALALLLCCGGIAGFFLYRLNRWNDPQGAVDGFLTALKNHDRAHAEQVVCPSASKGLSQVLQHFIENRTEVVSWQHTSTAVEVDTATVTVVLTIVVPATGRQDTDEVAYRLVKQDGDWKVCGFNGDHPA